MPVVALTIAGSDPSGGAGIQADLKTFHQFGVYGTAAITLITVQNTRCVSHVETLSPDLVASQLTAVLDDLPPAAAKTGALGSAEVVSRIGALAQTFRFPLVVDPVMVSKHGSPLMTRDAQGIFRSKLLPLATLLTPNIPEAEVLTEIGIESEADMRCAAERLRAMGCPAVLIKGGHFTGEPIDVLCDEHGFTTFEGRRINTAHTHGTGCTYSAAITAGLARGIPLRHAIRVAKAYIQEAIETAPQLGGGHGPVNHFASIINEFGPR